MRNLLWYDKPADFGKWEEQALIIGNGYMGASFFGGISREKITLNEKTLWKGGPSPNRPDYNGGNVKNSSRHVKRVRELLAEGEYDKAVELLPRLTGSREWDGFGAYQCLCDVYLEFPGVDDNRVSDYRRSLNMEAGVYECKYAHNGVNRKLTAFANYPDNVICLNLVSDGKDGVSFRLSLGKTHDGALITTGEHTLFYNGHLPDNALRYAAAFGVLNTGGEVVTEVDAISVNGADEAYIFICAGTDYAPVYPQYRMRENLEKTISERAEKAVFKGPEALFIEHALDFGGLFNKTDVCFGNGGKPDRTDDIPTDKLLELYKTAPDADVKAAVEELYFRFGRYALISSSRAGSLPANLQGVWNESNTPPWDCDYHINVNLQMNYWLAMTANLAETFPPLADFIDSMRPAGRVTAKEYYGIKSSGNSENGWVAHTQTNPFGWTAPGFDFYWGWSTAAAAWLMRNLWEYYEFTLDKDYLRNKLYPIMREAALFYKQWLIYDKKQERLVSSPSYSPEHGPVSAGNTYEQSLIEQFYADFIKASGVLDTDEALREEIISQMKLLKPFKIGKDGRILEWFEQEDGGFDRSKVEPKHRHISHLLGLYPGNLINKAAPDLLKAAVAVMEDRGDESTGWARAFKLNLWARTGDGERAYKLLTGLISDCTFPNMFDFHPPFQLDGNFGGSAGIAEMLLQSHEGYIEVFPSAPKAWNNAEFSGLCARGGFEVEAKREKGETIRLAVTSKCGGLCRIKINGAVKEFETKPNVKYEIKLQNL